MQLKTFFVAALFSGISYAIEFTSFPPSVVTAGTPVTVTWSGETSGQPVTILLRQGASSNLMTVSTLTSSATGGSFTWTPSESLANGSGYALEIQQSGQEPNYSTQFTFTGGSLTPNSVSSAPVSSIVSSISSSVSAEISSISSSVSAVLSNLTMSSTTMTGSSTGTSTRASSTSSRSSTGTPAPTTGAAVSNVQSPLALIMGAAAAMLYLH